DEPEGAENRHGYAEDGAVRTQVHLRAADAGADVAETLVRRVVEQVVMRVGRRGRCRQADDRAHEREDSCAFAHGTKRVVPAEPSAVKCAPGPKRTSPAPVEVTRNWRLLAG